MVGININEFHKKQTQRLGRATFKKAVISKVNPDNRTVDVYFAENPQSTIRSVPVAKNVDLTTVMPGDRCRVDLFDETNPSDMVLAFTY